MNEDNKFMDEAVINAVNSYEDNALYKKYKDDPHSSLKKGFAYIGEEKVYFTEKDFGDGTYALYVPEQFTLMDKKAIDLKYIGTHKPTTVYSNENGGINFSLYDNTIHSTEHTTREVIDNYRQRMKDTGYKQLVLKEEIELKTDFELGYFEMLNPASDATIYSIYAFLHKDDSFNHGFISIIDKYMYEWRSVALAIVQSIRRKEKS